MKVYAPILLVGRAVLVAFAIVLAVMANSPWPGLVALALLGTTVLLRDRQPSAALRFPAILLILLALGSSIVLLSSLTLGEFRVFGFDSFFAVQAWMIALALWPDGFSFPARIGEARAGEEVGAAISPARCSVGWRGLSLAWAFFGAFVWLGEAYLGNYLGSFLVGLVFSLGLVLFSKRLVRSFVLIQILNTFILLIIGLPLVDFCTRPRYHVETRPNELKRYYSYSVAKKDPEAFARWGEYCRSQWEQFENAVIIRDPKSFPPFRLRPNSRARMFQCDYSINSLGFRGREISLDKGNAYRIVALGESTTFGISLTADHRPWPELLEVIINERLKPSRPVEVINAGVPGATLPENLFRLQHDILALKPDLLISYHGYNGFHLLDPALPLAHGKPPPIYQPRPVKLLANAEYRIRLAVYKRKMTANLFFHTPEFSRPLETPYADAYRTLIEIARTNHIHLALADYSMAVNLQSDPAVIEFYRRAWPAVQTQIRANLAHSIIVQELSKQNPEVTFVDTHPNLDGDNEKFIDLVHFDRNGEQQMTEALFAAIKSALPEELSQH